MEITSSEPDPIEYFINESLLTGCNYDALLGNSSFYYIRRTDFYKRRFRIFEAVLEKKYFTQFFILISQLIKVFAANLRLIVRRVSFIGHGLEINLSHNEASQLDYIFVSHSFGKEEEADTYFGKIPHLVARGKNVLVAKIDHSASWLPGFGGVGITQVDDHLTQLVIPSVIPIRHLLKCYFTTLLSLKKLSIWPDHWASQLFGRLSLFGSDAIFDHCFRFHFEKLIDKARANAVVVITYEGYGWERRVCDLVHTRKIKAKVIGYHHCHYRSDQVSVNHKMCSTAAPDMIFVTNQKAQREFTSSYAVPVHNVGSFRAPGLIKDIKLTTKNGTSPSAVLLIPEGIGTEEKIFLRFISKFAKKLPETKFIYRPHPSRTHLNPIFRIYFRLLNLRNVSISENSLASDVTSAKFVVFRGSMAVYECLNYNAGLIFLSSNDGLSSILEKLDYQKISINDRVDMIKSILSSPRYTPEKRNPDFRHSVMKDICEPMNESYFTELLRDVRSSQE